MRYKPRFFSPFLLIIIILCCIAGCSAKKPPSDETPVAESEHSQEPVTPWSGLAETALQRFQTTEIPGVYHIDSLDLPENYFFSAIALHEQYIGMLIGEYGEYDIAEVNLKIFDMAENEICLEKSMNTNACGIEFFSDGTFYIPFYSGELIVYDLSGNVIEEYPSDMGRGSLYTDEKDRIWYFDNEALWYLYNGTKTSYDVPFSTPGAEIISVENEIVRYRYFMNGSETAAFDINSGKTDRWELHSGLDAGNGVTFWQTDEGTFQYAFEKNKVYSTNLGDTEYILSANLIDDLLYIQKDSRLTVLDTDLGQAGEITLENSYINQLASDNTSLVFTEISEEKERLYYIKDCEIPFSDVEIEEKTLTEKQQQNAEHAAALFTEYGVAVSSIPLKADTEINYDYKNTKNVTDVQMEEFLEQMELVLAEYPENFFRTLTSREADGVCVMLCNGLQGIGGNTLTEAGGLAYSAVGFLYIAINVDQIYNLKDTFSHEVLHTIENALALDYPDDAPFAGWYTLNPDDFMYGADYTSYYETSGKYVFDYTEKQLENAYFISSYGTINELEDRAEIFAEMVDPYEMFFRAPHIYQKAHYLAETLKEYYPEWHQNGKPLWMAYQNH